MAFGGITLGPWLVDDRPPGPPVYVRVAVEERFFHTTFGSCPSALAWAFTSSVAIAGVVPWAAGSVPMFQVTEPFGLTTAVPAPPGSTEVNVVPSTAGTFTVTFDAGL